MTQQESHKHHYVPRFLLRHWAVDRVLSGYWWNARRSQLDCNQKGTKAFCFEIDHLTLKAHKDGRDAIERVFFGDVDSNGAAARDLLLEKGPNSLDSDQRCDFARLLLSLEARRLPVVRRLREGRSLLANAIDNDPEIIDAIEAEGLSGSPSALLAELGISLEDRALGNIQGLVDNPKVVSAVLTPPSFR